MSRAVYRYKWKHIIKCPRTPYLSPILTTLAIKTMIEKEGCALAEIIEYFIDREWEIHKKFCRKARKKERQFYKIKSKVEVREDYIVQP